MKPKLELNDLSDTQLDDMEAQIQRIREDRKKTPLSKWKFLVGFVKLDDILTSRGKCSSYSHPYHDYNQKITAFTNEQLENCIQEAMRYYYRYGGLWEPAVKTFIKDYFSKQEAE